MSRFDISPEEFVDRLDGDQLDEAVIIDVREPHEWDYYHLDNTALIPMNTIPQAMERLPADKPLYIICAHGVRSAIVCNYLIQNGYTNVINVQGGMAAVSSLKGFEYD